MAFFKLNKFHWHLIDDQGWRVELKKFPKLTEVGANSVKIDENEFRYPGRQFYLQEEIKDIIDYAAQLFIEVIPEFEGPAHIQSLLASYPELGSPMQDSFPMINCVEPSTGVLNLQQKTLKTILEMLDEFTSLFPSKYVHIGGDEVDSNFWITDSLEPYKHIPGIN